MTAMIVSSSRSESPYRPRVFGARPFHTDGELLALRFSPDGTLWSVEEPGVLRQWDVRNRQQMGWSELGDTEATWCFSTAAHFVAAGSDELCLWETNNGELLSFWQQSSWVTALAFRPGALLLASGHDDGGVRLWDYAGGRLAYEIRPPILPSDGGGDLAVSAMAFSLDGRKLAVAAEDRSIFLWNMTSGEMLGRLLGHTDRIAALAWHPDCRRLISAGWDGTARVWDTLACLPIILLNSHDGQVQALSFTPDGRLLACADSAPAIHLWDMEAYRTVAVQRDPIREVRCLAFSPVGKYLASGGADRVIHFHTFAADPSGSVSAASQKGQDHRRFSEASLTGQRTCLAVSRDGSRLASVGTGTTLRVWNTTTGDPVLELEDTPLLRAFAASADGRWFAGTIARQAQNAGERSEADRNTLFLWRADDGRCDRLLEGQAAPIHVLAFNPDSTLLATAGARSSDVWLWSIPEGQPFLLPEIVKGCSIEALAFHPHRRLIAAGGVNWLAPRGPEGRIILWDLNYHRPDAVLPVSTIGLAFHPSGRRLAVATLMQSIVVWDIETTVQVGELIGHLDAVTAVAYSPDGRWLASGSDDRTLRLWDAETGEQHGLVELDTQIKALAFAPDGCSLFTGNGSTSCYQIDLWSILPGLDG
jgi:WD40 repeat protein